MADESLQVALQELNLHKVDIAISFIVGAIGIFFVSKQNKILREQSALFKEQNVIFQEQNRLHQVQHEMNELLRQQQDSRAEIQKLFYKISLRRMGLDELQKRISGFLDRGFGREDFISIWNEMPISRGHSATTTLNEFNRALDYLLLRGTNDIEVSTNDKK